MNILSRNSSKFKNLILQRMNFLQRVLRYGTFPDEEVFDFEKLNTRNSLRKLLPRQNVFFAYSVYHMQFTDNIILAICYGLNGGRPSFGYRFKELILENIFFTLKGQHQSHNVICSTLNDKSVQHHANQNDLLTMSMRHTVCGINYAIYIQS